jgi:nucleoside-diphosphate-sugar epimerase
VTSPPLAPDTSSPPFLILGGGFTGMAFARHALLTGAHVTATTRSTARGEELRARGVLPHVAARLDDGSLAARVGPDTRVLVAFPPDGTTDRAVAPSLARARAIAYVSSTGIYGDVRGRVDESTPLRGTGPRAVARREAEAVWRDAGAVVVRAPGIYGPGRGLHLRLARGTARIPGDGTNHVSRIHVEDLAAALHALLARGARDALYVAGDEEPATHADVVGWLCAAMGLPLPPHAPLDSVDETLRNDRCVDARRLRDALGFPLAFPTYREGFAECIAADGAAIALAKAAAAAGSA